MKEDYDFLVCGFTGGIPGSKTISCNICGTDVWVSPSGQKALIGNPALVPLCTTCARPRMQAPDAEIQPMTPEQELELMRQGITRERIDQLYEELGVKRPKGGT